MKETTYYCDSTGEEIEDLFEMLSVEAHTAHTWTSPNRGGSKVYHFSKHSHSFEYDRNENSFEVFIGDTGSVAMVKEETGSETKYYGQDTEDSAVSGLMTTIEDVISERE